MYINFTLGHPEKAINLEPNTFFDYVIKLEKVTPILIICYHGVSSLDVGQILCDSGFNNIYSLKGGYKAWKEENV